MFIFATLTLWFQQGCSANYPPVTAMVATATPSLAANIISNFGAGTTMVNPTLSGTNQQAVIAAGGSTGTNTNGNAGSVTVTKNYAGYFSTNTYGGSPANKINSPFILPNPGDGSSFAININCPLSDPLPSAYPADDLICNLVSGGTSPYFDATGFNGIQFELNILPDDTNTNRVFQIAIDVLTPTSTLGGTCTSGCYNYYQVVLSPTAGWANEKYAWNSITIPYGTNPGPLSTHLTKLLFLQWGFSDNGAGKNTNTDFWIDNVSFY